MAIKYGGICWSFSGMLELLESSWSLNAFALYSLLCLPSYKGWVLCRRFAQSCNAASLANKGSDFEHLNQTSCTKAQPFAHLYSRQKIHLVGERVSPAPLANPCHILLSHQQAQCLADVWVVAKVTPVSTTTGRSTIWSFLMTLSQTPPLTDCILCTMLNSMFKPH